MHWAVARSIEGCAINRIVSFGTDARGEIYIVKHGTSSSNGEVFKIVPACPTDLNNDGVTNVLDLIELLLDFGTTACGPTDIDQSGVVNVLDLIDLILDFGLSCP